MNSFDEKILNTFIDFLKETSKDYDKFTELFHEVEKAGFHITKSDFYSPLPVVHELPKKSFRRKENCNFNWNEESQKKLLEGLCQYSEDFQEIIHNGIFRDKNGAFARYDAATYYSIIRYFKPKKIVEIGAGFSTILSSIAAEKTNTSITTIDPYTPKHKRRQIPKSVDFIEKPVQELPLDFFQELSKNDILFIDSSHVSKINSDVNFLILEVLPSLKSGVLIHFHDISFPKEYSKKKILEDHRKFWNEQYLLNAFLIGNKEFEVMLGNAFMGLKHPDLLEKLYKSDLKPAGGSFWIRKI